MGFCTKTAADAADVLALKCSREGEIFGLDLTDWESMDAGSFHDYEAKAVSNATFFKQFNGDFEYLKLWKLSQEQGETYEQVNYSREEWEQLIQEILN